jgi:UDP-glucose 4-epimerase
MVVGGAGFVGSHLVDRLLAEGHAVDVVDDLSTGSLGNLADARAVSGDGSLKIHHLDVADPACRELVALRRPDVVFHLGVLPAGDQDVEGLPRVVTGVVSLLEAARLHGVDKVVVTLPASELYGDVAARDLPVKEGREWSPVGVRGVLARTVVDLLDVYRSRHAVEFTALALANVYGSRQRPGDGVVAAFTAAAADGEAPILHGDGRQTRDFVFIDDTVDALVRSATRGSGLVVNIGTGVQTSIRDLWTLIARGRGPDPVTAARRPADLARFAVSPVRARIHLAWSPWTDLAQGVRSVRG